MGGGMVGGAYGPNDPRPEQMRKWKVGPVRRFIWKHPGKVLLGIVLAMGGCTHLENVHDTHDANKAAAKGVQALRDIGPLTSYSQADGQTIIDDVQYACGKMGYTCEPVKWDKQAERIMSVPLTKETLVDDLIFAGDHADNISDPVREEVFRNLAAELEPYKQAPAQGLEKPGTK